MTATELLRAPGDPFEKLCLAVGGDFEKWRRKEEPDYIGIPAGFQCPVQQLSLAVPQILDFVESYGDALEESKLEIPGLPDGALILQAGLQRKQIEDFLADFDPANALTLTGKIAKQRLLERGLGPQKLAAIAGARPVLLFFRQTLEKLFLQPTDEPIEEPERGLEKNELWLPGPLPKTILLAPQWNGFINGPYLAMIGGDPAAGWDRLSQVKEVRNPFSIGPEELYTTGRKELRWETETGWPQFLTPLHLLCDGEVASTDPVWQALLLHRTNLCLVFSADRSVRTASGLAAIYSGSQKRVEIELAPEGAAPLPQAQREKGLKHLEHMVGWAYTAKLTPDRLSYLQTEIAWTLRRIADPVSFDDLLAQAENIRKDLDPHWRAFIERKIDAFSTEVRALENDVATTVQAFSDQTSGMIRKLSENMLAAVAVVLATYVATQISKGTDPAVLRIGVLFYLLYLLVFPVGFDMVERWRSFAALCEHFEERRQRYERGLGPDKVLEISKDPLLRSKDRFSFWFLLTLSTYLLVAVVAWLVIPAPFRSIPVQPPSAPELTGALAPNKDLRAARVIARWQVRGAEDVAIDRAGRLYTGTADGRIARLTLQPNGSADVLTFARTGGRPFGLRFDPAGNLIVAVAQKGLVSIAPSGKTTVLVSQVQGVPLGFVNTLDIARDGKIYFSESAPSYSPTSYLDELLESRSRGRLLVYDPKAQGEKVSVLLENLFFANGVALTTDQKAVLVAETYSYRIIRYWLEGPKKETSDVFAENLPGFPDNLTSDRRGNYWLALFTVRKTLLDWIHPHPFLKEQLSKLPFALRPQPAAYGLVAVFDEKGNIVRSLHDPGGRTVRGITTARPAGDKLYLGSFDGEWLASVPLTATDAPRPTGPQRAGARRATF